MRVDPAEFRRLDLRCHALLRDVPLHDVWQIFLDGGGSERTMRDVLAISPFRGSGSANILVRALFAIRGGLGRVFGWDDERHDSSAASYIHRLTNDDRAGSLIRPGTREGPFRSLYLFPNEAVFEIRNATVHAFLASALCRRSDGYTLYWAIYVMPVGALTTLYIALIDPFRRFIIYPVLIRQTQAAWARAYVPTVAR